MSICTATYTIGSGGVAGGAGPEGSVAFNNIEMNTSMGIPVMKVITGVPTDIQVSIYEDVFGESPVSIPEGSTVEFVVKPSKETTDVILNKDAIYNGNNVKVPIAQGDLPKAGLYPASFIVKTPEGTLHSEHHGYLYVDQGLNSISDTSNDPISISDVRMALMDYSPEANILLDDLEFSDLQIISAIKRPVREWNETPPDIKTYNYSNFPFHEAWLKATCSYLLESAAHKYNRNTLPHNASGLSLDPNNKGSLYLSTATALRQEWKAWIIAKKTEMNMAACWGATSLNAYGGRDPYDYI